MTKKFFLLFLSFSLTVSSLLGMEQKQPVEVKEEKKAVEKAEQKPLPPRLLAIFLDYIRQEITTFMPAPGVFKPESGPFARDLGDVIDAKGSSCLVHESILLNYLYRMKKAHEESLDAKDKELYLTYQGYNPSFLQKNYQIYYIPETPFFLLRLNEDQLNDSIIFKDDEEGVDITFSFPAFKYKEFREFLKQGDDLSFYQQLIKFVEDSTKMLSANQIEFSLDHFKKIFNTSDDLYNFLDEDKEGKKFLTYLNKQDEKENKEKKNEVGFIGPMFKVSLKKRIAPILKSMLRPLGLWVGGHGAVGYIASTVGIEFTQVLKFFDQLNITFIGISSCSVGGVNTQLMLKDIDGSQLNLSYPTIVFSITDAATSYEDTLGPNSFFSRCEGLFIDIGWKEWVVDKQKERQSLSDNEKKNLPSLSPDYTRIESLGQKFFNLFTSEMASMPQILIPRTNVFKPLLYQKEGKILLINDFFVAKQAAENRDLFINTTEKGDPINLTHLFLAQAHLFPFKFFIFPYKLNGMFLKHRTFESQDDENIDKFLANIYFNNNQFPVAFDYIYSPKSRYLDYKKLALVEANKKNDDKLIWVTVYPTVVPINKQHNSYFFDAIDLLPINSSFIDDAEERVIPTVVPIGTLQFIRDSFLNTQGRSTEKAFFIKKVKGFNDFSLILKAMEDDKIAIDNSEFLNEIKGEKELTLNNLIIKTSEPDEKKINVELLFGLGEGAQRTWWTFKASKVVLTPRTDLKNARWKFEKIEREVFLKRAIDIYYQLENIHEKITNIMSKNITDQAATEDVSQQLIDLSQKKIKYLCEPAESVKKRFLEISIEAAQEAFLFYLNRLGLSEEKRENSIQQSNRLIQALIDFLVNASMLEHERSGGSLIKEHQLNRLSKDQIEEVLPENTLTSSKGKADKAKLIESYQNILSSKDQITLLNKIIEGLVKKLDAVQKEKNKLLQNEKKLIYDSRTLLQRLQKEISQEQYKKLDKLIE